MTQLPDLHQATLDEETLDALFCDITNLGQDIEVTPKVSAREQVQNPSMTLPEAQTALRNRSIRAVQIRYDHQRQRWCDTLVPINGGWRLTRINLAEAASIVTE